MSVTKKKTLTSYDLSLACITAVDTMLRSIYNLKKRVDLSPRVPSVGQQGRLAFENMADDSLSGSR